MSSEKFLDDKNLKKIDRKIRFIIDRIGKDIKTEDEVFDKYTLFTLEKLISNKIIDTLDFPISTGKEGNIFRATTPNEKFVAVKIYRTSNSTFKHISNYIIGDPRFQSIRKTHKDIIHAWTKKEFKNLRRLNNINVPAPKPILYMNNILVMEYIGYKKKPAPLLKDVKLGNPKKMFDKIIDFIKKMYQKAQLVHSDMSSFNILIYKNNPYLIDLGQAVLIDHPNSHDFLKRDIKNIVSYFKKYNIKESEMQIYNNITKESDMQ